MFYILKLYIPTYKEWQNHNTLIKNGGKMSTLYKIQILQANNLSCRSLNPINKNNFILHNKFGNL